MARPLVAQHTDEFVELVLSLCSESVLDIGCGNGAFLKRAQANGIRATGIDCDPNCVTAGRAGGLDVYEANAAHLPFADSSFEWCTCARSAHHFESLGGGLAEALRVARSGVLIYDPWYDETIPSQITAARLERWSKRLDCAVGNVNNGPLSTNDFVSALPQALPIRIEMTLRLVLQTADVAAAETESRQQLSAHSSLSAAAELEAILEEARRTGLTEAGALFVKLVKTG